MLDTIPDLHVTGAGSGGQFFPRYTYESETAGDDLFGETGAGQYRRIDNITDPALRRFHATYGDAVTKDDVFFYIYGLLHAPDYRATFSSDLKKMLPRVLLVPAAGTFWTFVAAGRALGQLHRHYESVTPYPLEEVPDLGAPSASRFRVQKMRFGKSPGGQDGSVLVVNSHLRLAGIPDEAHEYIVGSRSALAWIVERYQVRVDKASGIVNDPNDWCEEVGDERYIIDLVKRIVTVSLETVGIVKSLPELGV